MLTDETSSAITRGQVRQAAECERCHASYERHWPTQKYCGRKCSLEALEERRAAWHAADKERLAAASGKPCLHCGDAFKPGVRQQKYCSRQCADEARDEQQKRWYAARKAERAADKERLGLQPQKETRDESEVLRAPDWTPDGVAWNAFWDSVTAWQVKRAADLRAGLVVP